MEMDWYMFTPAEHEYFRFLETGVVPARFAELVKSPTRKRGAEGQVTCELASLW